MPAVYAAFKKHMVSTTSYATKWYITLFANSVPFQMQLRLWDAFLLEGHDIFVIVAVAIVWVYRGERHCWMLCEDTLTRCSQITSLRSRRTSRLYCRCSLRSLYRKTKTRHYSGLRRRSGTRSCARTWCAGGKTGRGSSRLARTVRRCYSIGTCMESRTRCSTDTSFFSPLPHHSSPRILALALAYSHSHTAWAFTFASHHISSSHPRTHVSCTSASCWVVLLCVHIRPLLFTLPLGFLGFLLPSAFLTCRSSSSSSSPMSAALTIFPRRIRISLRTPD